MARSFAGGASSDRIDFGSTTLPTQRTLAFWFYLNAIDATSRRFLDTDDGSAATELINIDNTNLLRYSFNTDATTGIWQITNPSTGALHHFAATMDTSSVANDPLIYIDGVAQTVTELTAPTGNFRTSAGYIIGNRVTGGSNRAFDGRFSEWARWSRILSADEIAGLAKGLSPLFYRRSLTFHAPFIGNDSPERDYVGAGSGTVTGATKTDHPRIIRPTRGQIIRLAANDAAAAARFNIMGTVGM
jgi:hypothetical protein